MNQPIRILATAAITTLLSLGCANDSKSRSATTQPTARATSPAALMARVTPSLVIVRYTFDSEVGRRDLEGIGTIVSADGLVVISEGLVPNQLADAQMIDFKVILPPGRDGSPDETELDATFLGRDERSDVAYVKINPVDGKTWPALKPVAKPIVVGETLYSVGLLPKGSGYAAYLREARVSANVGGPVPLTLTSGGVTAVGSPVFDPAGDLIAFVPDQERQTAILNTGQEAVQLALPPQYVVTAEDYLPSLQDPPSAPNSRKLPWLGVVQMTGLTKEVAKAFGIEGTPAIQIGDVVPGGPAAKAGLNSGEVITAVDGQPLKRGDTAEELPAILSRQLLRKNFGDVVTFAIIREPGKAAEDVKVTLDERPAAANTVARFYAEDLGYTVRELVFNDRYSRRLDADYKGVAVTFVKEQSNAAAGGLEPNDIITKINETDVTDIAQFKETYEATRSAAKRDAVVFEVFRGVGTQIIRIQPPQ